MIMRDTMIEKLVEIEKKESKREFFERMNDVDLFYAFWMVSNGAPTWEVVYNEGYKLGKNHDDT